ncbi:BrnT family toxin [Trinickia symbiotica]|uniref:BrnT family toxin n=1 Tax=Trinickia symbiotica TaxID=863227 RepID=A0A2N7X8H2_9BURK|nr:BrnT family toxin [Trinickia symbiotica]PMS37900.1 BrnT family toxin [Trinickia symbiotica]
MNVEFDERKSEANRRKHGVPLSLAEVIDCSAVWSRPDCRRDYGELREVGYYPIDGRVHCIVFTQRGCTFRVISLRRASNREIDRYEHATQANS